MNVLPIVSRAIDSALTRETPFRSSVPSVRASRAVSTFAARSPTTGSPSTRRSQPSFASGDSRRRETRKTTATPPSTMRPPVARA